MLCEVWAQQSYKHLHAIASIYLLTHCPVVTFPKLFLVTPTSLLGNPIKYFTPILMYLKISWYNQKLSISKVPLGPFTSLISTIFSVTGFLLLTYNRTIDPASFKASTALLCVTSRTSTSFTRRIQSLTLETATVMLSCCVTAECTQSLIFYL